MMQTFFVCVYLIKARLSVLSLSFIRLITDKLTINWQSFAQVGLQLKFTSRIQLLRLGNFPNLSTRIHIIIPNRKKINCTYKAILTTIEAGEFDRF